MKTPTTMVTLNDFIGAVFGDDLPTGEHILMAKQNPDGKGFRHAPWGSKAANRWWRTTRPALYYTVSTVGEPEPGENGSLWWRRRKIDCRAAYVLVLDDIGTKIKNSPKVEPSYKLQSSEGNWQWGYIIQPCEDLDRYEAIVDALIALKLTDGGAGGRERVMRVPGSVNIKQGRGGYASNIKACDWHPDRIFELDDLATELGVALDDLQVSKAGSVKTIAAGGEMTETVVVDPLLVWLSDNGHITADNGGDWVTVTCPWAAEHTTGENTAGYSPLGRGQDDWVETRAFKCLHEHCTERRFKAFREWSVGEGAPYTSGRDPLPWLQARYVYIVKGKRVADMVRRPTARGLDWVLDLEEWSNKHYRKIDVAGHKQPILIRNAFLASRDTRKPLDLRYNPGGADIVVVNDNQFVNTYVEPAHKQTNEEPTVFLEHIRFLCGAEADIFLDWLAHKVQFPAKRSYAVIMVAEDTYGTGRSWLRACMDKVLKGKVKTATLGQLVGKGTSGENNYNDWLAECQFLVIDEAKDVSREDFYNLYQTFKERVDTRTVDFRCNPKYGRTREDTMFFNCMIFTNHSDAMVIPENDRRVYVIENPSERRDYAYYDRLEAALESDEPGRIYWYLKRRDVSKFDHIYPEMTTAKRAMIEQSISQFDEVMALVLESLTGDIVIRKVLHNKFKEAARELGYTKLEANAGSAAGRIWKRLGKLRPHAQNGARYMIDTRQEELRAVRNKEKWVAVDDRRNGKMLIEELKKNTFGTVVPFEITKKGHSP